jgi:hypothetical protein
LTATDFVPERPFRSEVPTVGPMPDPSTRRPLIANEGETASEQDRGPAAEAMSFDRNTFGIDLGHRGEDDVDEVAEEPAPVAARGAGRTLTQRLAQASADRENGTAEDDWPPPRPRN